MFFLFRGAYGGGSGAGGRSRGNCLDPKVSVEASISSPGRSGGNIAKSVYLKWSANKNTHGNIVVGEAIETIKFTAGVYDVAVWPVGHRELKQTLKSIEIKRVE